MKALKKILFHSNMETTAGATVLVESLAAGQLSSPSVQTQQLADDRQ